MQFRDIIRASRPLQLAFCTHSFFMRFLVFFGILVGLTTVALAQRPGTISSNKVGTATTAAAKPSPTPTDKASFESSKAIEDPAERAAALAEFVKAYPESPLQDQAREILTAARGDVARSLLENNSASEAIELLTLSVRESPSVISDRLFNEVILRFPSLLFVSGQRQAAVELADLIEKRIEDNAGRLVSLAGFHLSVENADSALRLAQKATELQPDSSSAFQAVGFAQRLNFDLSAAEASLTKAVELDGANTNAALLLAEVKRANGNHVEAGAIYNKILESNPNEPTAQAGQVLILFSGGKKAEAEAAFDSALKANPGNVALIGMVAYWYAANGEADNAVLHGEEAIDLDPRYVWGHIALGRGLMLKKKFAEAEQVLVKARAYGRFPSLEYEIAIARINAGLYRDAAEDLKQVFSWSDGKIGTRLGGRVERKDRSFDRLLDDERRASISMHKGPVLGDEEQKLAALLRFASSMEEPQPSDAVAAAKAFADPGGPMQVYRTLFAARMLLEKQVDPGAVLELTQSASSRLDEGLAVPAASTATLAWELYERRRAAFAAQQFIVVPELPRQTLSAVLRGRIEDAAGWALYQQKNLDEAIVRLRRAITVLPKDSAWWRSSMWRLGTVLEAAQNDKDALASYAASYKSEPGSGAKYLTIRAIYQRLNGDTAGLEALIGPNPVALGDSNIESTETPKETPAVSSAEPDRSKETQVEEAADQKDEVAPPPPAKLEEKEAARPEPQIPTVNKDPIKEVTDDPTKATLPEKEVGKNSDAASPKSDQVAEKVKPAETALVTDKRDLFEPVVISVPRSGDRKKPGESEKTETEKIETKTDEPAGVLPDAEQTDGDPVVEKAASSNDSDGTTRKRLVETANSGSTSEQCSINVSQNSISLVNQVGSVILLVGTGVETDDAVLSAQSSSPEDIEVRAEPSIEGLSGRSLFLIRSKSAKTGLFQVVFKLPCGEKTVNVTVN